MAIASFTAGVILGVFFLAVLVQRATQAAALIGLLTGLTVTGVIVFRTELAWPWYAVVGSSVTFTVGWFASLLISGGNPRFQKRREG
jgi:SSS family solute:Na+ symporter